MGKQIQFRGNQKRKWNEKKMPEKENKRKQNYENPLYLYIFHCHINK